jgi:hypothetical protein
MSGRMLPLTDKRGLVFSILCCSNSGHCNGVLSLLCMKLYTVKYFRRARNLYSRFLMCSPRPSTSEEQLTFRSCPFVCHMSQIHFWNLLLGYNISYEGEKGSNIKAANFVKELGIINQIFKPSLVSRHTRIRIYKTLAEIPGVARDSR